MKTSIPAAFGRLSIEVPKIATRSASTYTRYKKPRPDLTHFDPGHGEQIWVWKNIFTNQIIYSHKPVMDSNRALRQLPFNGSNSKPAKLRKDKWRPMALIQFASGSGVVGQSVFQKLREFRLEHELTWGWQRPELAKLERRSKFGISPFAEALNDQKSNSIADMAAVLAGAGRGNRIWEMPAAPKGQVFPAGKEHGGVLTKATVYWADIKDSEVAEEWSDNVELVEGMPPLTQGKGKRDRAQAEQIEMEASTETEQPAAPAP